MRHVMGYFQRHGFVPTSSRANRTDFLLDITCGKIERSLEGEKGVSGADFDGETWDLKWNRDGRQYLASCGAESSLETVNPSDMGNNDSKTALKEVTRVATRPAVHRLIYFHAKRCFLQRIKGNQLTSYLFIHLIAGIIMGIITCGGKLPNSLNAYSEGNNEGNGLILRRFGDSSRPRNLQSLLSPGRGDLLQSMAAIPNRPLM